MSFWKRRQPLQEGAVCHQPILEHTRLVEVWGRVFRFCILSCHLSSSFSTHLPGAGVGAPVQLLVLSLRDGFYVQLSTSAAGNLTFHVKSLWVLYVKRLKSFSHLIVRSRSYSSVEVLMCSCCFIPKVQRIWFISLILFNFPLFCKTACQISFLCVEEVCELALLLSVLKWTHETLP